MTEAGPMAGEPAPDTVTEAVQQLVADGYDADYEIRRGQLRCAPCGHSHDAEGAVVERLYRFEGMSDPDDEAIVLGLRCPVCGRRGVLVSGYGPSADPDDLDALTILYRGTA
jgi:hypothetical protein